MPLIQRFNGLMSFSMLSSCSMQIMLFQSPLIREPISHKLNISSLIYHNLLILLSGVCRKSAASLKLTEPCAEMSLLAEADLPPGSGPVKWLGQAESAQKADRSSVDMLLGWLASEHR